MWERLCKTKKLLCSSRNQENVASIRLTLRELRLHPRGGTRPSFPAVMVLPPGGHPWFNKERVATEPLLYAVISKNYNMLLQLGLNLGKRITVWGKDSRCIESKTPFRIRFLKPEVVQEFAYSRDLCVQLHRQKEIMRKCGCIDRRLPQEASIKELKLQLPPCHRTPRSFK